MNENHFIKARALAGKVLSKYSDLELHTQLKSKVEHERELLSEVISFIQEVDSRRMYFKFGYPSLFEYLTKEMKYSNGSAQRRISAARLLKDIPEFKTDLEEGYLNLGQIAIVSQGLKQKEKELANKLESKSTQRISKDESQSTSTVEVDLNTTNTNKALQNSLTAKKELLQKVMGQTLPETLKIVSQTLDLELKPQEKKTIQKDESVHLSITLSKEEAQTLQKAKELISHINPRAKDLDVIVLALKELVKRKDPALKKFRIKKDVVAQKDMVTPADAISKKAQDLKNSTSTVEVNVNPKSSLRKPISSAVKKALFQKYSYCQWKSKGSEHLCSSKFQLQIDHIKPIWAGGTNEESNLQILCSTHNRLKYLRESGRL